MTEKPLILFGVGELAEVAAYYFDNDSEYSVEAFTIDGDRLEEDSFCGRPVVAFEELASQYSPDNHEMFVAVGYSRVNALRQEKCEAAMLAGYRLATYVSSQASVACNATFGWNCLILEDNTVQPFVTVGNGVTLWSGNHIGHHASIGDFAFISSHVVVSGGVTVGNRTFIGVNATTNDHISVGARCVIGSGCLITTDAPDESVFTAEAAKLSRVPSGRLKGL